VSFVEFHAPLVLGSECATVWHSIGCAARAGACPLDIRSLLTTGLQSTRRRRIWRFSGALYRRFQMGVNGSSLTVQGHCKQLASVIAGTRLFLGAVGHDVPSIRGNACSDRLIGRAPLLLPCRCVCGGSQARRAAATSKPAYLPSGLLPAFSPRDVQPKTLLVLSSCFIALAASFASPAPTLNLSAIRRKRTPPSRCRSGITVVRGYFLAPLSELPAASSHPHRLDSSPHPSNKLLSHKVT
jgi:hypothetical protein